MTSKRDKRVSLTFSPSIRHGPSSAFGFMNGWMNGQMDEYMDDIVRETLALPKGNVLGILFLYYTCDLLILPNSTCRDCLPSTEVLPFDQENDFSQTLPSSQIKNPIPKLPPANSSKTTSEQSGLASLFRVGSKELDRFTNRLKRTQTQPGVASLKFPIFSLSYRFNISVNWRVALASSMMQEWGQLLL